MSESNRSLSQVFENIQNVEKKDKLNKKRFFIYFGILLMVFLYLRLFNTVFVTDENGNLSFKYSTAWYIRYPAEAYRAYLDFRAPNVLYVYMEDGITQIDDFNSSTLLGIRLPQTLAQISPYTFSYNKNMRWVSFPEKVDSELFIGDYAFYESGITTLELPIGTHWVRQYAFANCDSLKRVSVPEGIEFVELCTFMHCTSLKDISLPEDMKHIPTYFLYGCTALEDISFPTNLRSISPSALTNSILWKKNISEWNLPDTVFFAANADDCLIDEEKELQYLSEQTGISIDVLSKSMNTTDVWINEQWYSFPMDLASFLEKDSWKINSKEETSIDSLSDAKINIIHTETGLRLLLTTKDGFIKTITQNRNGKEGFIVFPGAIIYNETRWYRPFMLYYDFESFLDYPSQDVPRSFECKSEYNNLFDMDIHTDLYSMLSNGAITGITYYID